MHIRMGDKKVVITDHRNGFEFLYWFGRTYSKFQFKSSPPPPAVMFISIVIYLFLLLCKYNSMCCWFTLMENYTNDTNKNWALYKQLHLHSSQLTNFNFPKEVFLHAVIWYILTLMTWTATATMLPMVLPAMKTTCCIDQLSSPLWCAVVWLISPPW